ncbi:MAG: hypothetical protein MUP55_04130 [Candidatus Aenigmarchaeota archaeon]|nr:hypothetical protein [Candidatus Aenigmarchaeota archaeon]
MVDAKHIQRLTDSIKVLQAKKIGLDEKGIHCQSTEKLLCDGGLLLLDELVPPNYVLEIYEECRTKLEATEGVVRYVLLNGDQFHTISSMFSYMTDMVMDKYKIDKEIKPTIFMLISSKMVSILPPYVKQIMEKGLLEWHATAKSVNGKKEIVPGYG